MDSDGQPLLFGGRTAQENLDRAVAAGKLDATASGRLKLKPAGDVEGYLNIRGFTDMRCQVYNAFIFQHAFVGAAVPLGCRDCYKIKIVPPTLRALVALRDLLEESVGLCKCGVDFYNPHTRDFYSGFFYYDGLAAARAEYPALRAAIDAHPDLGPAVPVIIKRGCSNYEAACGPSDKWSFPDGLEELEIVLRSRFETARPALAEYRLRRMKAMVHWIKFAYWIGDDTYLDFTGGKPLYPPGVSYSPTG